MKSKYKKLILKEIARLAKWRWYVKHNMTMEEIFEMEEELKLDKKINHDCKPTP